MPATKPLKHLYLPEEIHSDLMVYKAKNKCKSAAKAISKLLDEKERIH